MNDLDNDESKMTEFVVFRDAHQMVMVSKVERHHMRIVAEVIRQGYGYYDAGISVSVKIREWGNPDDSNPNNFYKLRLTDESLMRMRRDESYL